MPIEPAPDYEDFDVASDQDDAETEYKRCKGIWMNALEQAERSPDEAVFHLETALGYFRAANQIRYRYQTYYKAPIDPDDELEDWPEPVYTPAGLVMPSFETMFDIHAWLYEYLADKHPNLLAHWPEKRD